MNLQQVEEQKQSLKTCIAELGEIEQCLLLNSNSQYKCFGYLNNVVGEIIGTVDGLLLRTKYLEKWNDKNLTSVFDQHLQLINRIFFTSLLIAIECGLKDIIGNKTTEIGINKRIDDLLTYIKTLEIDVQYKSKLEEKLGKLKSKQYSFNDYRDAVLKTSVLPTDPPNFDQQSKDYLEALRIIRNKLSHGYCGGAQLSEHEIKAIKLAKLSEMIDKDKRLCSSVLFFKLILKNIIKFFEEVTKNDKP